MRFQDQVAVVTGAGQGIGRAVVLGLAREGAAVAINDINPNTAGAVVEEVQAAGGQAAYFLADVSNSAQVREMAAAVLRRFGKVDVLINNATVAAHGGNRTAFLELTEEQWDLIYAVNLKGVFNVCKALAPAMVERKYGRIVNMGSVAGIRGGGLLGRAAYAAAKAGVVGLTKALARELAPYGINANCVCPSLTDTPRTSDISPADRERVLKMIPLGRSARPEEIAAGVLFLASPEASFVTGETMLVDGGVAMY